MNKRYRIYEYKGKYLVKERKWWGWSEWEYAYETLREAEKGIRLRIMVLVKETDVRAILSEPTQLRVREDLQVVMDRSGKIKEYVNVPREALK